MYQKRPLNKSSNSSPPFLAFFFFFSFLIILPFLLSFSFLLLLSLLLFVSPSLVGFGATATLEAAVFTLLGGLTVSLSSFSSCAGVTRCSALDGFEDEDVVAVATALLPFVDVLVAVTVATARDGIGGVGRVASWACLV